jgi:hypothetical protein
MVDGAGAGTVAEGGPLHGLDPKGRQFKACPKCGLTKPATSQNFPTKPSKSKRWRGRRVLTSWCRRCVTASRSEEAKAKNRLRRYELSVSEFELLKAGGVCQICGRPYVQKRHHRQEPVVDHDHLTGKIRGVICRACNIGLGYSHDDPKILEAAAAYLMGSGPGNVSVHSTEVG